MNKISIIIPIYNAKEYISRCLDSILKQTLQEMEVICVNDGSEDESLEICKKYARIDDRVKVYSKENGGAPSARNVGLMYATAEYITFVDSDDWLESRMYEKLYQQAKEYDADISIIGYTKDTDTLCKCMENEYTIPTIISDKEDLVRYAFIRDSYMNFGAYVWNKLFKKGLLEQKETLLFDEKLTRGDDVLFYAQAAIRAKKAVYSPECMYHYFQRDTSYTKGISLERGEGILTAYERIISLCEKNDITEDTIRWLKRFYVYHASLLAEKAIKCDNMVKLAEYKFFMKKYIKEYIDKNERYPERLERMKLLLDYGEKDERND